MKKRETIIIFSILIISILFMLLLNINKGNIVSVKNADGELLLSFDINKDNYYELKGDYGLFHIEVKDGKCRAIDVECPNHICESVGWISISNPLPIICLPNNIVININGKN